MRVIDYFTFFNEHDVVRLRLHTLNPLVDLFVVCECTRTHQNKPHVPEFNMSDPALAPFADKIVRVLVDAPESDAPWAIENYHREVGLQVAAENFGFQDDDILVISDADEIPIPAVLSQAIELETGRNALIQLLAYHFRYFFNCLKDDNFNVNTPWVVPWRRYRSLPGIVGGTFGSNRIIPKQVKDISLYHGCWHFSFLHDNAGIVKKAVSYSHKEFNTASSIDHFLYVRQYIHDHKNLPIIFINNETYRIWPRDDDRLPVYVKQNYDSLKEFFA